MAAQHRRAKDRGKAWEREVAKDLGTTRTGNRGTNTPDVISERWGVECKALKAFQLREAYLQQAKTNAGELPWIIPMKELGTGRKIAILDYKKWLEMERKCVAYDILMKENEDGD